MSRTHLAALVVLACISYGCTDTSPTDGDEARAPARMTVLSGNNQIGTVAAALAEPLVLRVTDGRGEPVTGVQVGWSTESGGTLAAASATTDERGVVSAAWTLGTTAGQQRATASVQGLTPLAYSAIAEPGPASVVVVAPETLSLDRWGDTARITTAVTDPYGNPLNGVPIAWSSADTTIAWVSADGLVRSHRAGEVTLTAASGALTGSAVVTVELQRNAACVVPSAFPVRSAVGPIPSGWNQVADPVASARFHNEGAHRAAGGDFDGDGDEDLIVLENGPPATAGRMFFWRNVGGTFQDATEAVLDPDSIGEEVTRDIEIADFNGDGVVDLFLARHGLDGEPYPGTANVLLLSQPDGTLRDASATALVPYERDGFTHSSNVADFDCDGHVDVFTLDLGSQTAPSRARVFFNNGTGALVADEATIPYPVFDGTLQGLAFDACDLDRDGDADLVVGRAGSSNPEIDHDLVLVNDGFGRFRIVDADLPPSHYGGANIVSDLRCEDLDLDGWPDVVAGNSTSDQGDGDDYLSIWRNRGDLVFEPVTPFEQRPNVGSGSNSLVDVSDINGDGWPDIIRRPFPREGALLVNDGGDRFIPVDLPREFPPLLDADGDGRLDLLWPGVRHQSVPVPAELYLHR